MVTAAHCCPQALDGFGGAIHMAQVQSVLVLEDVLFINNAAGVSGGALWVASTLHGQVNVSGAVFTGNKVCGVLHPQLAQCTKRSPGDKKPCLVTGRSRQFRHSAGPRSGGHGSPFGRRRLWWRHISDRFP
jgi:predicted outer membrane repeat protein